MPKKERKTKEDKKGDAFERLYALLVAPNESLPSLEKPHLAVVEKKIILPTQEEIAKEKAKEKAEFDKLYLQLSSLSSKREEVIAERVVSIIPIVETPLVKTSSEFNEVYAQIMHIIAMKSNMVQPIVEPIIVSIKEPVIDSIKHQCNACQKVFSSKGCFKRHQQNSSICKNWLSLPDNQNIPMIEKPIHMMVDDYLKQAITGDNPFQCRFCSATFTNRGNHHKHYQTALICNRMVFAEFKRIVAL